MPSRAGSPGLVRALLEHLQRQPGQLAEHEAALLAVLIEKVTSWKPACRGSRRGVAERSCMRARHVDELLHVHACRY